MVRERLLEAADRLFYSDGLRAVGIDRVLAEAGAAKASLYDHFASKDELITAYLDLRAKQSRATLLAAAEEAGASPVEQLLALFDAAIRVADGADFRGCPFQIAAAELPDVSHPALATVREQRTWFDALISRLVAAAGPVSPSLAPAISALYEGGVSRSAQDGSSDPLKSARWAAERLLAR